MSAPAPVGEDRIQSLDVLRGVALFGILMVNMRHFASPSMYMGGAGMHEAGTWLDGAIDAFVVAFGSGKFFPLFSFLFGVGLAIQLASWRAKGAAPTRLFLRRLSVLLAIGLTHTTFIWAGDILAKYAVLGLAFLVVLPLPPRWLLAGAAAALAAPLALAWADVDVWLAHAAGVPATAGQYRALVEGSLAAYGDGSFLDMTRQRIQDYTYRLTAWPYVNGLFTILAMFCLGAYAGRQGLFRAPRPELVRLVGAWGLAVWLGCLNLAHAHLGALGKVVKLAGDLSLTSVYVAAVVLLVGRADWRARLAPLASAGRMALTNYLLQSVAATAIFYGLGLYGTMGPAGWMALTVGIFALQVVASRAWMARFRFGPVEWLWRWATYGRRPPMRREAAPAATPAATSAPGRIMEA